MPASKELAIILAQRDHEKYKAIIERAANNGYHDHKFDKIPGHPEYGEATPCPKIKLVDDLSKFPELNDIREQVMDGDFDDPADVEDQEEMRGWLLDDNSPDDMFKALDLRVPSNKERLKHRMKKTFN